jgi:hypothetical protein
MRRITRIFLLILTGIIIPLIYIKYLAIGIPLTFKEFYISLWQHYKSGEPFGELDA